MSESLRGVVASHGALADALVDAVRRITGDAEQLVAVTNVDCSGEDLLRRIDSAVGNQPAIVFVDLPSGSCFMASARLARGRGNLAVVAGVNLAMLLDFTSHPERTLEEATARAVEVGGRAIRVLGQ